MSEHVTPRYRIGIDQDACGDAYVCRKCVQACLDHGANCIGFVNKEAPDPENPPLRIEDIDHKIMAAFMFNCDGCGNCVEVCPKGALTLIAPEPQIPRAAIYRDGCMVLCGTLADGTEVLPE